MSPEQARGKPLDKRTDIFSFGCVLYECLSGKQAFSGETVSDTLSAILKSEPDWSELPANTPPRPRAPSPLPAEGPEAAAPRHRRRADRARGGTCLTGCGTGGFGSRGAALARAPRVGSRRRRARGCHHGRPVSPPTCRRRGPARRSSVRFCRLRLRNASRFIVAPSPFRRTAKRSSSPASTRALRRCSGGP